MKIPLFYLLNGKQQCGKIEIYYNDKKSKFEHGYNISFAIIFNSNRSRRKLGFWFWTNFLNAWLLYVVRWMLIYCSNLEYRWMINPNLSRVANPMEFCTPSSFGKYSDFKKKNLAFFDQQNSNPSRTANPPKVQKTLNPKTTIYYLDLLYMAFFSETDS